MYAKYTPTVIKGKKHFK